MASIRPLLLEAERSLQQAQLWLQREWAENRGRFVLAVVTVAALGYFVLLPQLQAREDPYLLADWRSGESNDGFFGNKLGRFGFSNSPSNSWDENRDTSTWQDFAATSRKSSKKTSLSDAREIEILLLREELRKKTMQTQELEEEAKAKDREIKTITQDAARMVEQLSQQLQESRQQMSGKSDHVSKMSVEMKQKDEEIKALRDALKEMRANFDKTRKELETQSAQATLMYERLKFLNETLSEAMANPTMAGWVRRAFKGGVNSFFNSALVPIKAGQKTIISVQSKIEGGLRRIPGIQRHSSAFSWFLAVTILAIPVALMAWYSIGAHQRQRVKEWTLDHLTTATKASAKIFVKDMTINHVILIADVVMMLVAMILLARASYLESGMFDLYGDEWYASDFAGDEDYEDIPYIIFNMVILVYFAYAGIAGYQCFKMQSVLSFAHIGAAIYVGLTFYFLMYKPVVEGEYEDRYAPTWYATYVVLFFAMTVWSTRSIPRRQRDQIAKYFAGGPESSGPAAGPGGAGASQSAAAAHVTHDDLSNHLQSPDNEFPNPLASHSSASTESHPRLAKFKKVLSDPNVDLEALRQLAWGGVPPEVRPMTWQLLLGYLPTNCERRRATLDRKRKEYLDCIPRYFEVSESERPESEQHILRQILVDVPRTHPDVPLFQAEAVQRCLERILYIWAIRHPASGYVQGINDLVTPFFYVFLSEYVEGDPATCEVERVPQPILQVVEADSFWCLSTMLDSIQDHYTFAQPGIQRMVFKLKELVHRLDARLFSHLEAQHLEFLQFAFRWMNCLFLRELSLPLIVRLWDTYLAEGDAFAVFHVYVCAAFLQTFSSQLLQMEFQELVMFLQHAPTESWTDDNVRMILSQAYVWKTMFDRSPSHLAMHEGDARRKDFTLYLDTYYLASTKTQFRRIIKFVSSRMAFTVGIVAASSSSVVPASPLSQKSLRSSFIPSNVRAQRSAASVSFAARRFEGATCAFELPALPFGPSDLEPHYSAKTLEFHHGKHHQAYVTNLNKLVAGTADESKSLEALIKESFGKNPAIFNNSAQIWNHTFFWNCMKKNGGGQPTGALFDKIVATWGSFEKFQEEFKNAAVTQFGSGWAWLVKNADGSLAIVKTSNAETPITSAGVTPLLTVDVWEHAYYIDYQNRRPDFVDTFLKNLANWEFAAAQYAK
eukprot:tig00021350_g20656.t1